jgi:hypothetical protein
MDDPIVVKPGEQAVILGRENMVLYSDFDSASGSKEDLHLLDVIDSSQQDVLRIVATAMDRPGELVESDITFRSERKRIRVMHQPDYRTHIIFSPWEPQSPKEWRIQKPR